MEKQRHVSAAEDKLLDPIKMEREAMAFWGGVFVDEICPPGQLPATDNLDEHLLPELLELDEPN